MPQETRQNRATGSAAGRLGYGAEAHLQFGARLSVWSHRTIRRRADGSDWSDE